MLKFVFTCGDTNGIGPEIVLKSLNKIAHLHSSTKFYFLCPHNILEKSLAYVNPSFDFDVHKNTINDNSKQITILDLGKVKYEKGVPTKSSGQIAYKALSESYKLLHLKKADAVITAPVSKTALKLAGINFPGQTEIFANWCDSSNFVMTFLSLKMNAALLTIHKPLKEIPKLLKIKLIENTLNIVVRTLRQDLGQLNPKIAVLGLNPHAGEGGLIGTEEKDIIQPFISGYSKNIFVNGPFSPDAFFANKLYKNYNMIVGMYHDQILIPFKMMNFGKGVNYTAGLPIVRTSPDHGVAYDIAGKNLADESSMIQAYKYARQIVKNRKKKIVAS